MNKNTILNLAPNVLKRMEYGIDRFYLLNFNNDEIWTGNFASYLIINELDGIKTINSIIQELLPQFAEYSYEDLYEASTQIFEELLTKEFLVIN